MATAMTAWATMAEMTKMMIQNNRRVQELEAPMRAKATGAGQLTEARGNIVNYEATKGKEVKEVLEKRAEENERDVRMHRMKRTCNCGVDAKNEGGAERRG